MINFEFVTYKGLNNNIKISNDFAELIVPTELGIRVLYYGLKGGSNVFKNCDEQILNKDNGVWQIFGGHRLWHAPEAIPRTYEIDGANLQSYNIKDDVLTLYQKIDPVSNIFKEISLKLDENSSAVTVTHKITNKNCWSIKAAAWAVTVLKEGGFCSVVFPTNKLDTFPDRFLALWTYSKMNDERVYWGENIISVKQSKDFLQPFKYGMFLTMGKAIYVNQGYVFKKSFDTVKNAKYPDYGCNFECYTNSEYLECESLSPFKILENGESAELTEIWMLEKFDKEISFSDEKNLLQLF